MLDTVFWKILLDLPARVQLLFQDLVGLVYEGKWWGFKAWLQPEPWVSSLASYTLEIPDQTKSPSSQESCSQQWPVVETHNKCLWGRVWHLPDVLSHESDAPRVFHHRVIPGRRQQRGLTQASPRQNADTVEHSRLRQGRAAWTFLRRPGRSEVWQQPKQVEATLTHRNSGNLDLGILVYSNVCEARRRI